MDSSRPEDQPSSDFRGTQGGQVGHHNVQVNVFGSQQEIRRPWMARRPDASVTKRPELYAALADSVLRNSTGPATGIEGGGGFGKTTLAEQRCQDPRTERRFPGGLLWATVGEHTRDARLADLIGELCWVLSGEKPTTSNPQMAGARLSELLDQRDPVLLVIDDVWHPGQLAPFMIGGRTCHRLITTRNSGVAPRDGTTIRVDTMTTGQAVATLTNGIADVHQDLLDRLIASTGRWPLLLALVNAAVCGHVDAGITPNAAMRWALRQLESAGPTIFDSDLDDEDDRRHAVAATVEASLALLRPSERERYFDLAIVPEDTLLPVGTLFDLWRGMGMTDADAERLRAALVRLRLVQLGERDGEIAVRLHDVLGSYLRHRLTPGQLTRRHQAMVTAAAALLPDFSAEEPRRPAPGGRMPWWTLPHDAEYLWHRLPYHLAQAGRASERDGLVTDLRWVEAKITRLSSSVPVEVDLADVPGPAARRLRGALTAIAEPLARSSQPGAPGSTLYCYLSAVLGLEKLVAAYRPHLSAPQLLPVWPMPDLAGLPSRTLIGHDYGIRHCAFSPDGTLVATASHDHTVRVWDAGTGEIAQVLSGHTDAVSSCTFFPDGTVLATAGHDRTVRLWDVESGAEIRVLSGYPGPVLSCAFSPDSTLLATAAQDGCVRLADPVTGDLVRAWEAHSGGAGACAFAPDGLVLATTGEDRTLRVWSVATGDEVAAYPEAEALSCAFSPDGTLVAAGCEDGATRVWSLTALGAPRVLTGHTGAVLTCAFSPDGTRLASGGHDLTARVWDVATGTEQTVLGGHHESVTCCAFSADGSTLATSSHDWILRLWQLDSLPGSSADHPSWDYACAFSPDGTTLASAGYTRAIRIWDVATGSLSGKFEGHTDTISGCDFSPDGRALATSSYDGTVRTWNVAAGTSAMVLHGHDAEVTDCAFSPDGTLIASASQDGTVRLWDSATGQWVRTLAGHDGAVSSCAFSPDGTLIASGSHDHTIRIWATDTGATTAVLSGPYGHTDLIDDCTFSPDGALVASVSHDRTCKVWDAFSGGLVQTLARHTSGVTSCVFATDGTLLTTEIGNCQTWMWRVGRDDPYFGLSIVTPLTGLAWHPSELVCGVGEAGVYLFRYQPESGERPGQ